MKKNLTLLFVTLICFSVQAQKVDLKYKLEDNKTYQIKFSQTENKTTSMQGMTQNTETKTTMVYSIKPINQTPDFFIAQVKFDTMNISNNMPPMSVESKNAGDLKSKDPVQVLTTIINRLCNSEFVVKLDYAGKVLEMMNYDMVAQNVLKGTDDLKGQVKMVVEMQAKTLISKDMLKGIIESSFNYLPGKQVKVGDSWENNITMAAGGLGSSISTNYKLVSVDGEIATIEGKNSIVPASDEPVNMNGAMITSQLKGLGKLSITVDTKTGFIISGTIENQVSGNMIVNAQGNTMEIPVESISEATITAL